ncbi:hypothetical protein EBU71_19675, partial [bacterium]|nr:hypothetical protein [Candidatus Elulimicrobium humile]
PPSATTLQRVRYGNGVFVAVGTHIVYSYDGISWVYSTVFNASPFLGAKSISYTPDSYQQTGWNWVIPNISGLFTSSDGTIWTPRSVFTSNFESYFVAVRDSQTSPIAYSTDLTNWTGVAATLINNVYDIVYTDKFVCVGEALKNSLNNILTSSDGTVWTAVTNTLLSYSPTISRIITLDAETDFTGFTNGQSVTNWNGWTPVNAGSPPTYSTYNGGKFVLFANSNQQLRYTGGIGFNSATNGWTINFQSINIPEATLFTFTSATVTIVISYTQVYNFRIVSTISGSSTTMDFYNQFGSTTSGGWFDATISYNHLNHQFITTISSKTNLARYSHILEVPNATFTSVTFGGAGINNMYVNRIFIYQNYMEHLHAYNTSMSSSDVFIPSSFSTNWRKQAIVLSKITYGNNQYLISGRDMINQNYYFTENNLASVYTRRQILLNTSPLFKSSDGTSWSSMLNTG